MNLAKRIVWLFASPRRIFDDIASDRTSWWQPWLWLSLLYVVVGYFSIPINISVLETNPNQIPLADLDTQLGYMQRYAVLQLAVLPLLILFLGVIVSGVTYVVVSLLSERATFRRYFTLALYASIIAGISGALATAVVRLRGLDAIRAPEDAMFSLSLRLVAPSAGALVQALLSSFELFGVWALAFLVAGMMRIFGMTPGRAVVAVVPWWILSVLLSLLGHVVGAIG